MSNTDYTLRVAGIEQAFTSYSDAVDAAPLFDGDVEVWHDGACVEVLRKLPAPAAAKRTRRLGATPKASFFRHLARLVRAAGIDADAHKDFSGEIAFYHRGRHVGNDLVEVFAWAWHREEYGAACLEAATATQAEGHTLTDDVLRRIAA